MAVKEGYMMSQINLKDMIYKANVEAESELENNIKSERKQASWSLATLLFVAMILSVAWSYYSVTSTQNGPAYSMLESGEKIGLMILSDSLISDMRENGRLPDTLVGPLANVLDVEYIRLNDTDFELVTTLKGQRMTLRHENNQDKITSENEF